MKVLTNNAPWLWILLIMVSALYASYAEAETKVYLGAWSTHLVTDGDYNETHNLVAVEHNGWIAGTFKNSYSRESWFAGKTWEWGGDKFSYGLMAGAVRGYTKCYGDDGSNTNICPLVSPFASYKIGRVEPTILLLGEALAISIKIRL
jgi:hypothetical protein